MEIPVTSRRYEIAVNELLARYPQVNDTIIGASRLGIPLRALTIGGGAKTVLINASHHANEWVTTLILMRFIEESLCYPAWMENITLHCIPLVNPDGVDLVNGAIEKHRPAYKLAEEMSREQNAEGEFPYNWKANICGVDLNSNYTAGWELAKEHKYARGYTAAGPRDYVGPSPLSEPESCAMAAYTIFNDIDVTISLHTQGEEIYWRYQDYNPEGAENLARRFSAASGYECVDVPSESSHAGYRDWFIKNFNRPGFTIESGLGENPLPLSQFEDMYKKTSRLLWEALS